MALAANCPLFDGLLKVSTACLNLHEDPQRFVIEIGDNIPLESSSMSTGVCIYTAISPSIFIIRLLYILLFNLAHFSYLTFFCHSFSLYFSLLHQFTANYSLKDCKYTK